jgi:peptide/nickel transport system permease protein
MSDYSNREPDRLDKIAQEQHISSTMALDDEQRIKVLSPSMLVFRRFIRNRLAIVGVLFIVAMFLFSFVGGWLMPYGEFEVFKKYIDMSKLYAGVTINKEYRYVEVEGQTFPSAARAQFVLALNNSQETFESQGKYYTIDSESNDLHIVSSLIEVAQAIGLRNIYDVNPVGDFAATPAFEAAFLQAIDENADEFTVGDTTYTVVLNRKVYYAYESMPLALITYNVLDLVDAASRVDFDFRYQAELAASHGSDSTFMADGQAYRIVIEEDGTEIYRVDGQSETLFAILSRYIVQPLFSDVRISLVFKDSVKEAIAGNQRSFLYIDRESGGQTAAEKEFTIERDNQQWIIRSIEDTLVIKAYEFPSAQHWLGTDANGMDILTRMMYGGRISLMIGFIVVIIEVIIGVILGGIAGYFGKWIDNLLMRIVDIFNSIPSIPIIIIIGAVMDGLRVDPQIRMVYLMLILGILGWPGIARLVRGQILSLREQEFMVAAEATGLSVYRRIFKHLVPNVIPQLIVISTMSLGGIILTESVLSFLGLGVKYPFASWGNIINAVSNVHVMTNYWFVWIPAGFCILITVLGFNFIGDGLRDAFDPKMKR